MKTVLILTGKTTDKDLAASINDYINRIAHYMPFEVIVVPELRQTKSLSEAQQKEREGELIMKMLNPTDTVILLDERGKEFRSVEFATWMEKQQQNSRRLVFVVGGPYGFSEAIYKIGKERIALSKMTFSHQMVRLIFVEQLYRACTILRGEPYHHE